MRIRDLRVLLVFGRALSQALTAGLSPERALALSVQTLPPGRLSQTLRKAARSYIPGTAISETLSPALPPYLGAFLLAGESCGRLPEHAAWLSTMATQLLPLVESARKLWLYPAVTLGVGIVARLGILIAFHHNAAAWGLALNTLGAVAAIVIASVVLRLNRTARLTMDSLWLASPVFGETSLLVSLSFFLKTLGGLLLADGRHVTQMIDAAVEATPNRRAAQEFLKLRHGVEHMDTLAEAFNRLELLPPELRDPLVTGALTGKLEQSIDVVLRIAANQLEQRITILLPVLSKALGWMVMSSIIATWMQVVF